jgi:hypothetical protein
LRLSVYKEYFVSGRGRAGLKLFCTYRKKPFSGFFSFLRFFLGFSIVDSHAFSVFSVLILEKRFL